MCRLHWKPLYVFRELCQTQTARDCLAHKKLVEILDNRISGVEFRVQSGIVTPQIRDMLVQLRNTVEIWILVNDAEARDAVVKLIAGCTTTPAIFTLAEVADAVSKSEMYYLCAGRPTSAAARCHFNFAQPMTFQSCADTAHNPRGSPQIEHDAESRRPAEGEGAQLRCE
jgi:hypothetical protein